MCHEQFHRARVWDRESEDVDETDEESVDEGPPSYLADEDPDEDLEILTDGGDD